MKFYDVIYKHVADRRNKAAYYHAVTIAVDEKQHSDKELILAQISKHIDIKYLNDSDEKEFYLREIQVNNERVIGALTWPLDFL